MRTADDIFLVIEHGNGYCALLLGFGPELPGFLPASSCAGPCRSHPDRGILDHR